LNALIKRAIEAATVGQSGVGHGGSLNRQGSGEAENEAGITQRQSDHDAILLRRKAKARTPPTASIPVEGSGIAP
jgi:hypothetical protein